MITADEREETVLAFLDRILQQQSVRAFLDAVVARVEQQLRDDPAAVMAWESVPLDVYGTPLPGGIRSSWVFILRAGVATGAERHPNSHQRMMSYRGSGDLQTRTGERWESNLLGSDPHLPLEQRWISLPENTWHQAVTPPAAWLVVSFQTVPADELIEERPDPSDANSTQSRKYTGQDVSDGVSTMGLSLFHVDAFTDRPFAGNPAAVCLLPSWKEDQWLQAVAGEMNLSETAFLVKQSGHFDLRWFTPKIEVDLCGHATLTSAHVLWQQGLAKPGEQIQFSTRSGILKADFRGQDIELDFPLKPEEPTQAPPGLLEALGVQARYVGKNQFDYLVEVESEAVLRSMTPDFKRLATVPVRGIIVTSRSADPQFDFVSRFFAPASGVDEDPVTGSAHCCLGDFSRKRLDKSDFLAYQASARGGVVKVRVTAERAFLGGRAMIVAQGELLA